MKRDWPSFAIVTPSFNTSRYIGAAIQSVLDQNYPNLDYIVMDGGSTDGTLEILKQFGARLRWVSQKDKGQSNAINLGFEATQGEILGWLNSDDTLAPGALHAVAEIFAKHPEIDVVYGEADYIDHAGRRIGRCVHIEPFNRQRLLYYCDYLVQPATFFRRRAFEAVGGIDESVNWAMDYDLWLRLASAGRRFFYLPRLLAHFRWLSDNKTATGAEKRLQEITRVLLRLGLPLAAHVQLEWCHLHAQNALRAMRAARPMQAIGHLGKILGILTRHPRALESILTPATWRIIYTGQVLRARAFADDAKRQLQPS